MSIEFVHHDIGFSGGFWRWLFEWYRGVNKWGDREWGLRICGWVIQNKVDV